MRPRPFDSCDGSRRYGRPAAPTARPQGATDQQPPPWYAGDWPTPATHHCDTNDPSARTVRSQGAVDPSVARASRTWSDGRSMAGSRPGGMGGLSGRWAGPGGAVRNGVRSRARRWSVSAESHPVRCSGRAVAGICAGAWSSPTRCRRRWGRSGARAPRAAGASGAVAGRGGGAAASGHGLRAARRGAGPQTRAGLWGRCPRGRERAGTGIGAGRRKAPGSPGVLRGASSRKTPARSTGRRSPHQHRPAPGVPAAVVSPVPSVTGGSAGDGGVAGRGGMEARRASVLMHPPFPRTGAQPAESVRRGTRPSRARIPARAGPHPRAYLRARRLLAA